MLWDGGHSCSTLVVQLDFWIGQHLLSSRPILPWLTTGIAMARSGHSTLLPFEKIR